MSKEYKKYRKKIKKDKIFILLIQIGILLFFIITWEVLSNKKIINSFIFSSPSKIVKTIIIYFNEYNLLTHILTTIKEIIIAFIIGTLLSFIIASLMYLNNYLARIIDPIITLLNSLPKVALGPIIIIWVGANNKSIIVMALLINLFVSITNIYNSFIQTDMVKIKLFKSLKATNFQILKLLVIPSNYINIISTLKINISMTLIGVIMGEFLVSKKGIGYLIMYGTQIFDLSLVLSGIFIILIISYCLYNALVIIEEKTKKID